MATQPELLYVDLDVAPITVQARRLVGRGRSRPEEFVLADGSCWIARRYGASSTAGFLADVVAHALANAVGAAVPEFRLGNDGEATYFLSRKLEFVRDWDDGDASLCANPSQVTTILALDALVLNDDRHVGNIMVEQRGVRGDVHVWGIDFDGSLLLDRLELEACVGAALPSTVHVGRPPESFASLASAEHVSHIAEALALVPLEAVRSWLEQLDATFDLEQATASLSEPIWRRLQNADMIVRDYLESLTLP